MNMREYVSLPGVSTDQEDLASRADIVRVVDDFYGRVRADAILGPIFDDVAHTDWERHLPKMYDFWETVLFGAASFTGNPLAVHRDLATQVPLGEREFGRWLSLFHGTVDALFHGPRAEDIKVRASRIAAVMQYHIPSAGVR
jgi:hemoglobin